MEPFAVLFGPKVLSFPEGLMLCVEAQDRVSGILLWEGTHKYWFLGNASVWAIWWMCPQVSEEDGHGQLSVMSL